MKLVPIPNFQKKVKKASDDKLRRWHNHAAKFHLDEYRQVLETEILERGRKNES